MSTHTERALRESIGLLLQQQGGAFSPCACMGPQNDEPVCPCQMRSVAIVNGRYVMGARDLGPVRAAAAIGEKMGDA